MQYIWNVNNPTLEIDNTSLYNIAIEVCLEQDISIAKVRSQSQKQNLVEARRMIARRASDVEFKPEEIAKIIKKTRTTIYNYL